MQGARILGIQEEFDGMGNPDPGFATLDILDPDEPVGIAPCMAGRAVTMFLNQHFR
jgi:hypothetical protein